MGYPQITQIRTDFSEKHNGLRSLQHRKHTPFPHLCKSAKSVDENSLSPPYSRPFAGIRGKTLPSKICANL